MQKILVFIVLLKCAVNASGAPPTPAPAPLPQCIELSGKVDCHQPDDPSVSGIQKELTGSKRLHLDHIPFKDESWNNHTCDMFNALDGDSSKILISWLIQSPAKQNSGISFDAPPSTWDISRAKKMAANITSQDMKVLRNKEACQNFSKLLASLSPSVLEDMRADCVSEMVSQLKVKTTNINEARVTILDQMTDFFLERYARQIISKIQRNDGDGGKELVSLASTTLFKLFKEERNCSLINPSNYKNLIKDKEKAKIFGPVCFAAFGKTHPSALLDPVGSYVTNLPDEVFQINTHELHNEYFANMTLEQASNYNKSIEIGFHKCGTLKLDQMKGGNIHGVDATCAASHIYLRSTQMNGLGILWNKISNELFTIPRPGVLKDVFSRINSNDWPHIKGDLLNKVFEKIDGCEHLPAQAIANKTLRIPGKCFQKMNHRAQAKVLLVVENLDDDLLDYVDGDMVVDWSLDYKGKHYLGLECLMALNGKRGAQQLIERLGSKAEGRHPCSTLNDFESLKKNTILQKYMTADCFREQSVDIRENQWKHLNPRLIGLQSYEKIVAQIKDWSKIASPQMEFIIKGGTFCKSVTFGVFSLINKDALKHVDAQCVADLPIKGQLEQDQLGQFPETSFTLVTADGARSFSSLDKLSDKQFGLLGANVADKNNSGAAAITSDHISTASKERLASIKVWGKIPSASYKGIVDKEKFNAIPPDSMTEMTLDQVKEIPILHEITVPQIEKIGKNIQGAESPIHAFTANLLEKMSSEQKTAIEKRKKEIGSSSAFFSGGRLGSLTAITLGIISAIIMIVW